MIRWESANVFCKVPVFSVDIMILTVLPSVLKAGTFSSCDDDDDYFGYDNDYPGSSRIVFPYDTAIGLSLGGNVIETNSLTI